MYVLFNIKNLNFSKDCFSSWYLYFNVTLDNSSLKTPKGVGQTSQSLWYLSYIIWPYLNKNNWDFISIRASTHHNNNKVLCQLKGMKMQHVEKED